MANDQASRGNPSRQQSAEGAQAGLRQGGPSQPSGGALQARRGASSMAPYSDYGGGPFSMMRRISEEMDRLFESFGMGRGLFPSEGRYGVAWDSGYGAPSMWSPHIEVCERNGKLLIQADLPGMKRDDIDVRIEQDQVIIQGERQQDRSYDQEGYYRSERSYGSFYRAIPLPEGANADSASATFRDGVLEIEVDAPRRQQRGRTLEIREGRAAGESSGGARQAGTGSGATYGSGTSGAMQGATSGPGQQSGSGTSGAQHSASGAAGSQHSSGSETLYGGSGNPSAGASGVDEGAERPAAKPSTRGSRGG